MLQDLWLSTKTNAGQIWIYIYCFSFFIRLYEAEFNAQVSKISSQRKLQVGTKGRSEKIRTYNVPQNRVTDHRIHYSANVEQILNGGEELDKLISSLQEESRKETLVELLEEFQREDS